jgi:hypothetical protein
MLKHSLLEMIFTYLHHGLLGLPIATRVADAGHESRKLARELMRHDGWKLQIVKRKRRAKRKLQKNGLRLTNAGFYDVDRPRLDL